MSDIGDSEEVLFRQIHPAQVHDGVVSSLNFVPMPKDTGFLSVDRNSLVTAAESFDRFIANGNETVAVFGVTVGEFKEEMVSCHHDPLPDNDAHALADYNSIKNSSQIKKAGKRLKAKALSRGIQHGNTR